MQLFQKLFGKSEKNKRQSRKAVRRVNIENDKWWIQPQGKPKSGPFTLDELKSVCLNEQNIDTLAIRRDGEADWIQWGNAPIVFPFLGRFFNEINKSMAASEQRTDDGADRGLIRFIFLVAFHPEPITQEQVSEILSDKLPELKKQPSNIAKSGFLHKTVSIQPNDSQALAETTFGKEISDESKYVHRTIKCEIKGGDAVIHVVYDRMSENK